jgi:hypothetical protein
MIKRFWFSFIVLDLEMNNQSFSWKATSVGVEILTHQWAVVVVVIRVRYPFSLFGKILKTAFRVDTWNGRLR